MLSAKLKEQTKSCHHSLEKKIISQIQLIKTTEDYSKLLLLFYSFFGGLELVIEKQDVISFFPDYYKRRKTATLKKDLSVFDIPIPIVAPGNDLPEIINNIQIIGLMYVIEGSTLGGSYIAKMIRDKLQLPTLNAFVFFDSYGDQTINMWNIFKKNIDALVLDNKMQEMVVASANDTFNLFSNWCEIQHHLF